LRDAASTQLIGEEAVAAGLEGEYEEGNYDGADDDDDDDDDENVTDATPWGIEEVVFQSNEDGKGVQAFVNGEEVPLMDNEELHAHYVEMKRSRPYTSEKSPEAEYETDLHVCREMHELKDKAMVLANLLPNVPLRRGFLLWRFIESNEQAVRYIGSIAIGGKKGERSWEDLIRDRACRRALVLGLVGRALKEWVFDELWFGCLGEESQALEEADMDFLDDNDDGTYARLMVFVLYDTEQAHRLHAHPGASGRLRQSSFSRGGESRFFPKEAIDAEGEGKGHAPTQQAPTAIMERR